MKMESKRHGFYEKVILRREQTNTQSEQTEMQADRQKELAEKVKHREETETAVAELKCAPTSVELGR